MILTAYFDESGTHGGSPITVMGGVMANASQWSRFNLEFDRVRRKYGFRIFHTKKFKSRSGDFANWPRERCLQLVWELADITKSAFMELVAFPLDNATYESDYRLGEKPKKLRLDSRYGLCFRQCLLHFLREVLRRERKGKLSKLDVVLESGHTNAGDAERIFRELKTDMQAAKWEVLGSIAFADKGKCNPRQVICPGSSSVTPQVDEGSSPTWAIIRAARSWSLGGPHAGKRLGHGGNDNGGIAQIQILGISVRIG